MDRHLLAEWRGLVNDGDTIICLGNVAHPDAFRDRRLTADLPACPGERILVRGNHDTNCRALENAGFTVQHRYALHGTEYGEPDRASRMEWLKRTGHEGRWLRNEFDEATAQERIDEIARRRRPRPRRKEAKPARLDATAGAEERLKLQEKLSDQGWIDDATPAEETGAFIDAIEAATAPNGIGPAVIGRLAGYGLSLQRDNDGRVVLDHVGPCGLGTQIVRMPNEPGRLRILTGITVTDEQWLEGAGGRMRRTMERIAAEPAWTAANVDRRRASCSAAPSRWAEIRWRPTGR